MREINRAVIPAKYVQSLCWQGDELVDWAGGGIRYQMDGTATSRLVSYGYRFDRADSSSQGQFSIIYEVLGTKGLVLKDGKIIREINRSFYCADAYEYPVAFLRLPSGRDVLVHCPEEYNKLEIEDVETGERLTLRSGEAADFFHSRLQASPDGQYLLSAGWIWHPIDDLRVYDVAEVMSHPARLDAELDWEFTQRSEITNAAFAADSILMTTGHLGARKESQDTTAMGDDQIGHYSLREKRFLTIAPLKEPLGTLMPVGNFAVGFYEHPKLVEVAMGEIVTCWPELETGNQNSSIGRDLDKMPPLALDPANKRFAVADAEKITVIQLG